MRHHSVCPKACQAEGLRQPAGPLLCSVQQCLSDVCPCCFGCCAVHCCAVTVNISNIYPLSVPLSQNGSLVRVDGSQEMLLRPVIHLFGNKNRTLDGKVLKVRRGDDS